MLRAGGLFLLALTFASPNLIRGNIRVLVISFSTVACGVAFGNRTRRRITFRVPPFPFILHIANYLDRTSMAHRACFHSFCVL